MSWTDGDRLLTRVMITLWVMSWKHFPHFLSFMRVPTWWRHQMETFSALLAICAGNSPVPGEFPTQRPATRSFDVFFDVRPNKQLSKQSWGWWFETLSPSLWRHRNEWIFTEERTNNVELYVFYAVSLDKLLNKEFIEKWINQDVLLLFQLTAVTAWAQPMGPTATYILLSNELGRKHVTIASHKKMADFRKLRTRLSRRSWRAG